MASIYGGPPSFQQLLDLDFEELFATGGPAIRVEFESRVLHGANQGDGVGHEGANTVPCPVTADLSGNWCQISGTDSRFEGPCASLMPVGGLALSDTHRSSRHLFLPRR